ncbi:hypothetical protein [Mariniluteicoccus flavus]
MATPTGPEVRRYELPFTAGVGRLVNGAIGVRSVAQRGGESAAYTMDVTVLDAPDHRLVRAGIWLAHRVVDGRGEWYLAAPQWSPWLPEERVELMGHDDLPDAFADLVRPFRRGSTLGPVAALRCRREEYALRGDDAELLAILRNELVTIRSGGVVTARYREVTLTSVESRLTPTQAAWISEVLAQAGATRVEEFPDLAHRLGAPATGLADIPAAQRRSASGTLETYVQTLLATRLRKITHADLALRGGLLDARDQLSGQLSRLLGDVRGLVPLLDRAWASELESDLVHAVEALDEAADDVPAELNSRRYLVMLDRLVSASRAPRLGDSGPLSARDALADALAERVADLRAVVDGLAVDSPDPLWDLALEAAARVADTCGVQPERAKPVRRLQRRAERVVELLEGCVQVSVDEVGPDLERLTPQEAFDAGREFERQWADQHIARLDLLDHWERRGARLTAPRRGTR